MSPLQQALLVSGSIFAVVMATQLGRRGYAVRDLARPLAMCAGVGWFYLKDAPTAGVDWLVYAIGALVGVGFGVVASLATGLERDTAGRVWTRCGLGFVSIWVAAVVVRVVFIWSAEHDLTFRAHLGAFMYTHGIVEAAIAPFFVLMALAMVLARIALVATRVHTLRNTGTGTGTETHPQTTAPVAA